MDDEIIIVRPPSRFAAALLNVFLPGTGYLLQERYGAFFMFWLSMIGAALCVFIIIGIIMVPVIWIGSVVDVASYKRPSVTFEDFR